FMELTLYHPKYGYYASGRARIGRRGDFFTNVSVGPLFGKLLAAQFVEIWEKLGRPGDFEIVEQGAHDGLFAADALSALRQSGGVANGATVWNEKFVSEHRLSACAPSGVELRCHSTPFTFVTAKVSDRDLLLYHLGLFPAGFETEVNLAAPKLMSEIATKLSR